MMFSIHPSVAKALAAESTLHNPSTILHNPSAISHNPSTLNVRLLHHEFALAASDPKLARPFALS
jgi:hypothetical protein